jgi:hypothetical protein
MDESAELDPSVQKRRVNDRIWEGLSEYGPDAPIAFFCECGVDDCYRVVWLSGGEYDEARRDETWWALADHRPPDRLGRLATAETG